MDLEVLMTAIVASLHTQRRREKARERNPSGAAAIEKSSSAPEDEPELPVLDEECEVEVCEDEEDEEELEVPFRRSALR